MQTIADAPLEQRTPLPTRRGPISMVFRLSPLKSKECGYTQQEIEAFARAALDGNYKILVRRLGGDPKAAAPL